MKIINLLINIYYFQLLNTALTVRHKTPGSHSSKGWQEFTTAVINALNKREKPMVFLLWGKHAQTKVINSVSKTSEIKQY